MIVFSPLTSPRTITPYHMPLSTISYLFYYCGFTLCSFLTWHPLFLFPHSIGTTRTYWYWLVFGWRVQCINYGFLSIFFASLSTFYHIPPGFLCGCVPSGPFVKWRWVSGCNVEEFILLKLSSFPCWVGFVLINFLSCFVRRFSPFVTKIWSTRFPVLACVQGRNENLASPDAVGRLWIVARCIPHSLLG